MNKKQNTNKKRINTFTLHDFFELQRNQQKELDEIRQGKWYTLYDSKICKWEQKINEPFKMKHSLLVFFTLIACFTFAFAGWNFPEAIVYGFFAAIVGMIILIILGSIGKECFDVIRVKKCEKTRIAKETAENIFKKNQADELKNTIENKIEPQIDELIDTNFGSSKRNEDKEAIISFVFHEVSNIINNVERGSHIRSFCADINIEISESGAYVRDINDSYNIKSLLYNKIHIVPFYDIERISLTRTLTSRIQQAMVTNYPEGKLTITFDLYAQEYTTCIRFVYEETNPDFQRVGES